MEKKVSVRRVDNYGVTFNDQSGAVKSDLPKDVKVGDRFYIKVDDNTNTVEKIEKIEEK